MPTLGGGGAERVTTTLLSFLDPEEFVVRLVVANGKQRYGDLPPAVEVVDLKQKRMRHTLSSIVRHAREFKPDIVYTTIAQANTAVALVRPFLGRKTICIAQQVHMHGGWRPRKIRNRLRLRVLKRLLRQFDYFVCENDIVRQDCADQYNFPLERIRVIPNPVDVRGIRSAIDSGGKQDDAQSVVDVETGAVQFVAAGRLQYEKGFDILLEALARYCSVPFRLQILGDGTLRPALEQQAKQLGIQDRVSLLGFQKSPYAYFAEADALILPSRADASPNVVLEALACQTPVIATPALGGVAGLIKGVDGCVLADDVAAEPLGRAINKWVQEKAKESVPPDAIDGHDPELVAQAYKSLFDAAVDARHSRGNKGGNRTAIWRHKGHQLGKGGDHSSKGKA